ncbi:MAG: acyl-CoA dehydrogenase [Pseudomonadota bacterium]|nr:acyl-CoA dehydrogenase [Pseudomonadota bacterium]
MDFSLTQEQQMLQDSARRLLEAECRFEARAPLIATGSFDRKRWQNYADMGWFGISLAEEAGGFGGSVVDMTILMEECGRMLVVEPVWAIAVLAAQTLAALGDDPQAQQLLPALIAGEALPVLAHNEADAGGLTEYVATTATRDKIGTWRLSGQKALIIGGNVADRFIVSARTSGNTDDREGITLFLVKPDAVGLSKCDVRLIDNRWCSHLELDGVEVGESEVLGPVGGAFEALEHAHAHGIVTLCAEAIGVMEKALWVTRDYLKMRKQFGVTLSTFQALQHRMSEMLIELELSRCMVYRALSRAEADPESRRQALASAKVHVGRSGKFVCGQAIQLHGGIGVTEEYLIGHHFKRMTTIDSALGSTHFHLQKLAAVERSRPPSRAYPASRNAA